MDTSIIINGTDNMNAETEKRNLTAKTGDGHNHQQNRKKNSEQQQQKKPNKEQRVVILGERMVKHLNGWEMPKSTMCGQL